MEVGGSSLLLYIAMHIERLLTWVGYPIEHLTRNVQHLKVGEKVGRVSSKSFKHVQRVYIAESCKRSIVNTKVDVKGLALRATGTLLSIPPPRCTTAEASP